ncbi:hypothetical protein ABVT39_011252 [Epinephelus coioides]
MLTASPVHAQRLAPCPHDVTQHSAGGLTQTSRKRMRLASDMDYKVVFATLETVCEENIAIMCGPSDSAYGAVAKRLVTCLRQIQEHGRALEPVIASFTTVFHHYDFDAQTPGNGYRTLVKVLLSCLLHIIHKGRYIASNYNGAFFRAEHNASEMEAYCSALCQLRALLHLAQQLINDNDYGQLYSLQDGDLSNRFVQEYSSMHKACFYGRCLGFQYSPTLRPFLQTVVISMVSYGETYGKHQSGFGLAALSLLTSGKYVIDPELRGAEFERITQNLDMQFWKSFWNLTESGLITGFSRIASCPVQVNFTLTVPPVTLRLPLASDPNLTATVSPPIAHWGPGPVHMRLISHELREGQESEELLALSRTDPPPISAAHLPWVQKQPRSPWLLIHFHGGGFVAQTSKSHENYLRNWSKELNVPVLSVDYSLSPEAPFPRALEECFYAYCWALNNCHLLGVDCQTVRPAFGSGSLSALGRDTAVLLSDLTQGASNWIQSFLEPMRSPGGARSLSLMQRKSQSNETQRTSTHTSTPNCGSQVDYPDGFEPLRSECLAVISPTSCPIIKNPFVSPLLAPNNLLRGLPPVHIVASALDALLDDSVMFAKKLRDMGQPVSLTVVEDLPHGFLSLSQLAKETEVAASICVEQMRKIFQQENGTPALRKRPKQRSEETCQSSNPSG